VDEIGGVGTLAKLISSGWGLAAIEGFIIAYLFKLLLKSWEERTAENKQDKAVFERVTEALEAIERKTERRR
jgi:membrane protein implicated in regulation of membrane protease activity